MVATWAVDYDDTGDPFPRVRKVEASSSLNDVRTIVTIERLDFTALPRSEFMLTAYGLPEPDAVVPGSSRRLIYLIVTTVIAVIAAMVIRTIRRAKAARKPGGQ